MSGGARVIVVGARRRRQGIGEHVARWFARAGAEVCAVIGTTPATVEGARKSLEEKYHVRCRGYTSLDEALAEERPDAVVICSPYEVHREQLETVARAGVHCLCEKPLWWGASAERRAVTERIAGAFVARGRYLGVITQWPFTLEGFYRLYPELREARVERFHMELGPASCDPEAMVLDAAPHPLSMLQHLLGPGRVEGAAARFERPEAAPGTAVLRLWFDYRHRCGVTEATCAFTTCPRPPRPAAYAVNGLRVERRIELPEYSLSLAAGKRRAALEDPLALLVRDFLARSGSGARPECELLAGGMAALEALWLAARDIQQAPREVGEG